MNKQVSKCCKAKFRVEGGRPDFIGDKERSCTCYYVCNKCNKTCDTVDK